MEMYLLPYNPYAPLIGHHVWVKYATTREFGGARMTVRVEVDGPLVGYIDGALYVSGYEQLHRIPIGLVQQAVVMN